MSTKKNSPKNISGSTARTEKTTRYVRLFYDSVYGGVRYQVFSAKPQLTKETVTRSFKNGQVTEDVKREFGGEGKTYCEQFGAVSGLMLSKDVFYEVTVTATPMEKEKQK